MTENNLSDISSFSSNSLSDTSSFLSSQLRGGRGSDSISNISKFTNKGVHAAQDLSSDAIKAVGSLNEGVSRNLKNIPGIGDTASNISSTFKKGIVDNTDKTIKGLGLATRNVIKNTGKFADNTIDRTFNIGKNVLKGDLTGTLDSSGKLITGTGTEVIDNMKSGVNQSIDNKYINLALKVFIGLYAAFIAPHLSKTVSLFLDNMIVRIGISILIIYVATVDASMAILLSLAYVLSLQTANKYKAFTLSDTVSEIGNLSQEHFVSGKISKQPQPYNDISEEDSLTNDPNQLNLIGSNKIPGANQNSEVNTWKSQLSTQGLVSPIGVDEDPNYVSHFGEFN
jgi:hypothetical protein